MTTPVQVVAEARAWLDTPFLHQARLRGVGCDCVGLVIGVARALGLVAPGFDVPAYPRTPDGTTLMALTDAHMRRKALALMQPGDVVVVAFDAHPQHLGIVGDYRHGGHSIIHAHGPSERVIETRLMFGAHMRFAAAYALPGVA